MYDADANIGTESTARQKQSTATIWDFSRFMGPTIKEWALPSSPEGVRGEERERERKRSRRLGTPIMAECFDRAQVTHGGRFGTEGSEACPAHGHAVARP